MKKRIAAFLLCAVMLLGLAGGTALAEDMVTVNLYIPTLAVYTEEAIQEVQAAINEHLAEHYGIQTNLTYIEIGNFEKAINLAMTTDELDVTCYFIDGGQLANYVRNGQLLDITERFENAPQEVKDTFTEAEVLASSMHGRMYGFVRKYQYGGYETVVMNKAIVEELGIDAASIDSMDKLGEVLYQVHEAHPEIYALVPQSAADMTWIRPFIRGIGGTTFAYSNLTPEMDATEVQSVFETESFRNFCAYTNQWYKDGLIMADAISNTREGSDMVTAGAAFATLHNADTDPLDLLYPNTVCGGVIVPAFANAADIGNLQYGISVNSAHPDEAFTLLCALYTDAKLHTLLSYGIEGKHYVINDEGRADYPEGMTAENEPYGGFAATAAYPNYLLNPVKATSLSDDYAKMVEEWDAQVAVPESFGFFFDTTEYGNFVSAYKNVEEKYLKPLWTGSIALDDVLPTIQAELTGIGFYEVLAEVQTQLDAFLAEKEAK